LASTIQDYQPDRSVVLAQDSESAQTPMMREARAQRIRSSFQPPVITTTQPYRTAHLANGDYLLAWDIGRGFSRSAAGTFGRWIAEASDAGASRQAAFPAVLMDSNALLVFFKLRDAPHGASDKSAPGWFREQFV